MSPLPRLFYNILRLLWRLTKPTTVGVRLILVRKRSVLLVKHSYQHHWYLPGGGVRKGETVEKAGRREATEELGSVLGTLHLFGVYTTFQEHKNDHVVVLSCRDFTLTGVTDREIGSFGFFGFDDLPNDVSPGTLRRIREFTDNDCSPGIGSW